MGHMLFKHWRDIIYVNNRQLSQRLHPDVGESVEDVFSQLPVPLQDVG